MPPAGEGGWAALQVYTAPGSSGRITDMKNTYENT